MKRPAPDTYRAWLVAIVMVLALIAGWWISRATDEEVRPTSVPAASPPGSVVPRMEQPKMPPAQHAAEKSVEMPAAAAPRQIVDIFAVRTWEPPPPPPMAVAPVKPEAPPLPFRFMGRIVEPGQRPVFLLVQGQHVMPVKVGEAVAGDYRLEKFEGGRLYFRYRPMNQVQMLAVGTMP